jgi:hypothetical protein
MAAIPAGARHVKGLGAARVNAMIKDIQRVGFMSCIGNHEMLKLKMLIDDKSMNTIDLFITTIEIKVYNSFLVMNITRFDQPGQYTLRCSGLPAGIILQDSEIWYNEAH